MTISHSYLLFFIVYSGNFSGSSASNRGSSGNGNYWSSTANSSNNAYNLNFNSSNVNPGTNNNNKYNGFAVRCVAVSCQRFIRYILPPGFDIS